MLFVTEEASVGDMASKMAREQPCPFPQRISVCYALCGQEALR
jgi:hypothetical protein